MANYIHRMHVITHIEFEAANAQGSKVQQISANVKTNIDEKQHIVLIDVDFLVTDDETQKEILHLRSRDLFTGIGSDVPKMTDMELQESVTLTLKKTDRDLQNILVMCGLDNMLNFPHLDVMNLKKDVHLMA